MPRYFIEVFYKGTHYSGFQTQENANTIQAELEKAIEILKKERVLLTSASRTDSGVHALQNYFHFDSELDFRITRAQVFTRRWRLLLDWKRSSFRKFSNSESDTHEIHV